MILVVFILGFFTIRYIFGGIYELTPFNYGCYTFFFFGVLIILERQGRRKLILPAFGVFTLVLLLIAHEAFLIFNILSGLFIVLLVFALVQEKLHRKGFTIFMIFEILFWIACFTDNKLAVICLIVGTIYMVGILLKRDVDYGFIVLLAFAIICFMPVREEPIRWTLIRNTYHRVVLFAEGIMNEVGYQFSGWFDFENSFAGYSEDGYLTGAISGGSRQELEFTKNGSSERVYLKGSTYKTITPEGMTDKELMDQTYNEWMVEFINALRKNEVTKKKAACFTNIESAEIKFEYIRTSDVIRPENLMRIDEGLKNGMRYKQGKGFDYKVQYMSIDYGSPYFLELLENNQYSQDEEGRVIYTEDDICSYEETREYVKDTFNVNLSVMMSEEKYNDIRARLIDGTYRSSLEDYLDTSMSNDDIKKLQESITADAKTSYEKAKLIEAYLRNYTYDTSVDLRGSDNYINDFLFDKKSGYCIHYAATMVLLLRDAGIPARFASGYMYNSEDGTQVMNNSAHAWVEAYIDGIGWMTFEPTAANPNAEMLAWGKKYKGEETAEVEVEDQLEEWLSEVEAQGSADKSEKSSLTERLSGEKKGEEIVDMGIIKRILIYVGIILLAAAFLVLSIIGVRKLWFSLLTPEKKLTEMVKKVCKDIEKSVELEEDKNLLKKNDGSLYDYLKFAEDETYREKLRGLFDLYYRYRFRGDEVTEEKLKGVM